MAEVLKVFVYKNKPRGGVFKNALPSLLEQFELVYFVIETFAVVGR